MPDRLVYPDGQDGEALPPLDDGRTVHVPGRSPSRFWWGAIVIIIGLIAALGAGFGIADYIANRGDAASESEVRDDGAKTRAVNECRSFIASRYDQVINVHYRLRTDRDSALDTVLVDRAGVPGVAATTPEEFEAHNYTYLNAKAALEAFRPVLAALEQHPRDMVAENGWAVPKDIVRRSYDQLPHRFRPCTGKGTP